MEGSDIQDGNLCLSMPILSMEITTDVPPMESIQMSSSTTKKKSKPMSSVDSEIESSKIHWSEPFEDRISETIESNKEFFRLLQKKWGTNFFQQSDRGLETFPKIAEGGQAEIFTVYHRSFKMSYHGEERRETQTWKLRKNFVMKVFKEGFSLQDLEKQWPLGLLEYQHNVKFKTRYSTENCCQILGATLLENGRFAFVLEKYWGDLRKAIDCKMQHNDYQSTPFTTTEVGYIVVKIAWGVRELHENNIVHGDLKASNVLVDGPHSFPPFDPIKTKVLSWKVKVADFECSVGIVGTTYWRAPEILQAVRDRKIEPHLFTEKVDVYSFAMTCYEVLTGMMPFQDLNRDRTQYIEIIEGLRPNLPEDINPILRTLLSKCWHGDPSERPTFKEITKSLREIYPSVYVPRKWVRTSKRMMTSKFMWDQVVKCMWILVFLSFPAFCFLLGKTK